MNGCYGQACAAADRQRDASLALRDYSLPFCSYFKEQTGRWSVLCSEACDDTTMNEQGYEVAVS
jgi:hypothetical protein